MASLLFPVAKSQFFDNNGKVLSLGSVEVTYATTSNPAPTYLDSICSAQNEFPVLLTAAGKADIYLQAGNYNIVTRDKEDVIVDTVNEYIVESGGGSSPEAGNVPIGGIIMYNGLLADIPTDWHLCDGASGTPNLAYKFVRGTTLQSKVGDTGGSNDAVLVAHTHSMGSHTHSINHNHASVNTNSAGNHYHKIPVAQQAAAGSQDHTVDGAGLQEVSTKSAGSHTHSVNLPNYSGTSGGSSAANTGSKGEAATGLNMPSYYTLAYIQRIT